MCVKVKEVSVVFAEARAIHFAMRNGILSYQQAKLRTKPLLHQINNTVTAIATRHKVKPKYVTFQDLGVTL